MSQNTMNLENSGNLNYKNFSDARSQRAEAILKKGEPETIDEYTYLVPSQFSDKKYKVTHIDSYSCECEDFKQRCQGTGLYCKHIKAIILFEKLKNDYEVEESRIKQKISLIIDEPLENCCPSCASLNLIKRGVRITKFGEKQRFSCKDCQKRFVLSPIQKIKGNAKLVCLAMDCFYKGLSYRDISDQFKQFYGLSLHHETIRRWVLRFSEVMEKYSKELQPQTSGIWNADETMVLTKRGTDKRKHNANNSNFDYVWNVMDNETKFLLASVNSGRSRKIKDVQTVMKEALEQNKEIPKEIITDRYMGYNSGISKTFRNWGKERKVKHISIVGRRKIVNNNAIENHHTLQKEFHKVRKGVTKVQEYQDGFKVYHNFVKKGTKDNLTPAERGGIKLEGNRWNTLLLNSLKVPQATGEKKMIKSP